MSKRCVRCGKTEDKVWRISKVWRSGADLCNGCGSKEIREVKAGKAGKLQPICCEYHRTGGVDLGGCSATAFVALDVPVGSDGVLRVVASFRKEGISKLQTCTNPACGLVGDPERDFGVRRATRGGGRVVTIPQPQCRKCRLAASKAAKAAGRRRR